MKRFLRVLNQQSSRRKGEKGPSILVVLLASFTMAFGFTTEVRAAKCKRISAQSRIVSNDYRVHQSHRPLHRRRDRRKPRAERDDLLYWGKRGCRPYHRPREYHFLQRG